MNWSTVKGTEGNYTVVDSFFYGNHREARVYGQALADSSREEVSMFSENGHYEAFEPKLILYTLRAVSSGWTVGTCHQDEQDAINEATELAFVNGDVVALLENDIAIAIYGGSGRLLQLG